MTPDQLSERRRHIDWAITRATDYISANRGDLALPSFVSDMSKGRDLGVPPLSKDALGRGMALDRVGDREGLRKWIESFRT